MTSDQNDAWILYWKSMKAFHEALDNHIVCLANLASKHAPGKGYKEYADDDEELILAGKQLVYLAKTRKKTNHMPVLGTSA